MSTSGGFALATGSRHHQEADTLNGDGISIIPRNKTETSFLVLSFYLGGIASCPDQLGRGAIGFISAARSIGISSHEPAVRSNTFRGSDYLASWELVGFQSYFPILIGQNDRALALNQPRPMGHSLT